MSFNLSLGIFYQIQTIHMVKCLAPGEARTHGLQIMRLTRCLLRYGGCHTIMICPKNLYHISFFFNLKICISFSSCDSKTAQHNQNGHILSHVLNTDDDDFFFNTSYGLVVRPGSVALKYSCPRQTHSPTGVNWWWQNTK